MVVDDIGGARRVVEHLIERGYRTIAHAAGPSNTSIGRDRCRGYLDALKAHGLDGDERRIVHGGFEEEDGVAAFRAFCARGPMPDAIFAVNDPVARRIHAEIKRSGRTIPSDVAVAGFGDNRLSAYLDPPLTTVSQSPYEIGKIAAAMLLRRINDRSHQCTCETEVIQTCLIVRAST